MSLTSPIPFIAPIASTWAHDTVFTASAKAVSKPKLLSRYMMSLSIVLGIPMTLFLRPLRRQTVDPRRVLPNDPPFRRRLAPHGNFPGLCRQTCELLRRIQGAGPEEHVRGVEPTPHSRSGDRKCE